jgi:uncharacterized protein
MTQPRYCPDRPLPPYSYVPGLAPHPLSDPRGHSFGRHEPAPQALDEASYLGNAAYRYAIDLFNHGFYWEAHEAWESLWHLAGRRGTTADFLKGLIKLAAAGVKAREGKAAGVRQHAARAVELFSSVAEAMAPQRIVFGLCPANLIDQAKSVAASAEQLAGHGAPDASRLLPVTVLPRTEC